MRAFGTPPDEVGGAGIGVRELPTLDLIDREVACGDREVRIERERALEGLPGTMP
jgi:hypothetical protein